MVLTGQQLLQTHPETWHEATVHPFLQQCHSGQIHPQQFNTWLVQDYLFVIDFTRMLGRTLAIAPSSHFSVLLGGLSAIRDELEWFRHKATERQLNLDTNKQPACREYCDYMDSLATQPYAVQATALWAIELAYNQGWQQPGEMPPPYDEFANRWGNPEFTDYVKLLERQADETLESAPDIVQQHAEETFVRVAQLEKEFWQMAFTAKS